MQLCSDSRHDKLYILPCSYIENMIGAGRHAVRHSNWHPTSLLCVSRPSVVQQGLCMLQVSQAESVPGCASWNGSGETAVQSSTVHSKDSIISQVRLL